MSDLPQSDTLPPSMDPDVAPQVVEPPVTLGGILRRLGPGLIIAGSIVGSGELIATTKTGAQAGIALLWLIIIGCLIKVFVQIELGRYAISEGETTLAALNQVPGPRLRANWIVSYWVLMMIAGLGQLGGIVGGVGQAMAISFPLRGDYADAVTVPSERDFRKYIAWEDELQAEGTLGASLETPQRKRQQQGYEILNRQIVGLGERGSRVVDMLRAGEPPVDPETGVSLIDPPTFDDKLWAAVVALLTSALLFRGRYSMIQNISIVLVVCFTFITLGNVLSLQATEQWRTSSQELLYGLSFQLPGSDAGIDPLRTALATFGIIGVGASELVSYPYWCLEKGYAKFTGPRTEGDDWVRRARGWMRVMRYDAFISMGIYTVATLAFFIMGVAVLHNEGRDPEGMRMVSTLAAAYVPVFGEYARWLFLVGAIAVLYSTFLVSNAGHARTFTDGLKIFSLLDRNRQSTHDRSVRAFSTGLPLLCLTVYVLWPKPVSLILLSGLMQAMMLPMLAFAALYLRYTRIDKRIAPGVLWDAFLLVSSLGMLIAGGWGAYSEIAAAIAKFG